MNSERVHELQLLAMGLGGPPAMLSARRNSNESGFVKKISREGGGAQKFHHDFLSHLGPCSINWFEGDAKWKYFQHAGALLTADGSDDELIQFEGAPVGYKVSI